MIIGLTGNIAAGKSTVIEILKQNGANVLRCDDFLHEAYITDYYKKSVIKHFGKSILTDVGTIDRLLLKKELVKKPWLSKLIWNITTSLIETNVKSAICNHTGLLFFEAGQLYESKWDGFCKKSILCYCPDDLRANYLIERSKKENLELSVRDAISLLAQQEPQYKKFGLTDYIIFNFADIDLLKSQTLNIYSEIMKEYTHQEYKLR